jgi:hypothetical protein
VAQPNLINAAKISFEDLYTLWLGGTIKARLTAFWKAINPIFDANTPNDEPCGNWVELIAALATEMSSVSVTFDDMNSAAQYVYRLCWLTNQLNAQTPQLVTNAQAAAVLAAYNSIIE